MAGLYAVNMSTAVLSVRLPEELKRRLDDLGSRTGRPATFYVREAIESYIDDLEYAYALRAEAEAVRRGEIKTRRLDEIAASLDGMECNFEDISGELTDAVKSEKRNGFIVVK